jgi:hypothetical protein
MSRYYSTHNARWENVPEERKLLWEKGAYQSVSGLAQARSERTGDPYTVSLKKVEWRLAFKGHCIYSVYTQKMDDFMFNICRTHLKNKSTVVIVDKYAGIKLKLDPVSNKEQALEDWNMLKEFYRLDKIESKYERSKLAERYATKDLCESYGIPVELVKVNKGYYIRFRTDDPDTLNAIKQEIRLWGPVFDISVKLDRTIPTYLDPMTKAPEKPTYAGSTGYYYMGDDLMYADPDQTRAKTEFQLKAAEMRSKVQYLFRVRKSQDPDSIVDIINAYMQIMFYKEHLDEFFPHDTHYMCECGNPVNRKADTCHVCGKDNIDQTPEEQSYEVLSYKVDRD